MKVAVTGGSGQLGSLVLARLFGNRKVKEIVSIDLHGPTAVSPKLTAVQADVRDPSVGRYFQGCDAVVHLAFVVSRHMPREMVEDINVGGSRNVFAAAAAAGVKRICYTSSIAAYGVVPGHPVPIVEETPRQHQPSFAYAATKFEVETFLDAFEAEHPDISVVRLRPAILIGARMDHLLGRAFRRRVLLDLGAAPLPIVWDEDVADAVMLALTPPNGGARGAFNLAADAPLTSRDLAKVAGMRLIKAPRRLIQGAAMLGPLLGRAGVGQPFDPAWAGVADVAMIISSERAKRELGWAPSCRTAEDVMKRYLADVPVRPDRRLALFFHMAAVRARRRPRRPGVTTHMEIHVNVTGPGGGDWTIILDRGKMAIRRGRPTPANATIRLRTDTFLQVLAGAKELGRLTMTGRVQFSGEPTASLVFEGLISAFRAGAATPGAPGFIPRQLSRWFARGEP